MKVIKIWQIIGYPLTQYLQWMYSVNTHDLHDVHNTLMHSHNIQAWESPLIFKWYHIFPARLQLNELVSWRCSPPPPSTNELAGYTGHVGSCFSVPTTSKQKISNEFDNSCCWGLSVTTNHKCNKTPHPNITHSVKIILFISPCHLPINWRKKVKSTIKVTLSTGQNYADFLNFTQDIDTGGIKKCLNGLCHAIGLIQSHDDPKFKHKLTEM